VVVAVVEAVVVEAVVEQEEVLTDFSYLYTCFKHCTHACIHASTPSIGVKNINHPHQDEGGDFFHLETNPTGRS